jgi:hypothetical protein
MATLDIEIAMFDTLRSDLEAHHMSQWVLIQDRYLVSTFATFDAAAQHAVATLGRGPYLIRQVGAQPIVLPASVMFPPAYDGPCGNVTISARKTCQAPKTPTLRPNPTKHKR